jgi:hypothetical protein
LAWPGCFVQPPPWGAGLGDGDGEALGGGVVGLGLGDGLGDETAGGEGLGPGVGLGDGTGFDDAAREGGRQRIEWGLGRRAGFPQVLRRRRNADPKRGSIKHRRRSARSHGVRR